MQPNLKLCNFNDPVPSGDHMHRCHDCGTAWTHANDLPDQRLTAREFDIAHSCPQCGREETFKYTVSETDVREYGLPMSLIDEMKRAWQREVSMRRPRPLHLR